MRRETRMNKGGRMFEMRTELLNLNYSIMLNAHAPLPRGSLPEMI